MPVFTIRFQQGQRDMPDGFIVAVEDGVAGAGKFPDQAFFMSAKEAEDECMRARSRFGSTKIQPSTPERRQPGDISYEGGGLFGGRWDIDDSF